MPIPLENQAEILGQQMSVENFVHRTGRYFAPKQEAVKMNRSTLYDDTITKYRYIEILDFYPQVFSIPYAILMH